MDKQKLIQAFISEIERELGALKDAARATYEAATHEEAKPENKYDTRGLEASYLAGAQAKRVLELEKILSLFQYTKMKDFTAGDPISPTALVTVESAGKTSHVFLMAQGGGFALTVEGLRVQVVTPQSQLGEALLGLFAGDNVDVEIGEQTRPYRVLAVS
jgi:transcription elongation GreA/GreB family factor